MKRAWVFVAAACSILLTGCGEDKLVQETTRIDTVNADKAKAISVQDKQKLDEQQKFYTSIAKPVKEVLNESDNEKKQILTQKIIKRDAYKNQEEFAVYCASKLADFYNGNSTSSEYYSFLKRYGSSKVLKNLPATEEKATEVLSFIQESILESNTKYSDYILSEVTLNNTKDEGYFYRKVTTQNDFDYFRTTIVKENNVWKFSDDQPSPPFEEINKATGKEVSNATIKNITK